VSVEVATLRRTTRAGLCLECGKCATLCPLAGRGDFSARRLAGLHFDDSPSCADAAAQRCLTCSACETRCPQGVRFAELVRGLREWIPQELRWPCPHGGALQALARGMAQQTPHRDAGWLGSGLRVAERGEVALFVGCAPYFDALFADEPGVQTLEVARSAVRLLNAVGVEPVIAADERCCGHDLLWSGDRAAFEQLARANAAAFEARGVRRILTACAECCRTWRSDYPAAAPSYRPRVEHLSEFLVDRLEAGELQLGNEGPAAVTYQDPCRLGRQLGVIEAPRRLIAAAKGTRLLEMGRSGRDAQCCGSPGFTHCDATSRALQTARLREAAVTGASRLLTACPKCQIHFRCAQAEDRRRGRREPAVEVEDLTVFLAARLSGGEEQESVSPDGPGRSAGEGP